ncbi:MAG: ABC transporter permease, partial [Phycisphaerales bacterium]|nr:ABC transporter permease [Phycisphaerales bacterium]
MKIRERAAQIDRVQRSMPFKIVASIVVVVVALLLSISYWVAVNASDDADLRLDSDVSIAETGTSVDAAARAAEKILSGREDVTSVFLGAAVGTGVFLAAIWLDLGLTYLGVLLLGTLVAWPLMIVDSTASWGRLLAGVLMLGLAFAAIMRLLNAAFSLSNPVLAVARNVLTEAMRMKVTILFILLLVLGMAWLPEHLRSDQPLRYRVQSFLQYGTGGSFWVIALMTLVFSVSSMAFEQRDRTIWQTVTKPIASWQYVLGKWLGVVALNAALLGVSTSGVFMFTEYLRLQPALGETQAYESPDGGISEDRMILETQVLTASVRVAPDELTIDSPEFQQGVEQFIANQRVSDPTFATEPSERQRVEEDLYKGYMGMRRSIPPGEGQRFVFKGLEGAFERNEPITLRYRIDSGSNRPDVQYDLSFSFNNDIFVVRPVGLGYTHTVTIHPGTVASDGVLEVDVYNAHMGTRKVNPQS